MNSLFGNERDYPLNVLARALVLAPPSIRAITEHFQDIELIGEFWELIQEYLPEHERELKLMEHQNRMMR